MSEPRDFIGIFDFELNTLASGLGSLKIAPRVNPLVAIEILLTAILFLPGNCRDIRCSHSEKLIMLFEHVIDT
ncbi:Uncharacterised protein [Yersinia aleksiciae]|uniref:Uncharacterized protein n=1 Tax=Yersinia aleksiciae TaxID=263819 RepID=A0A0T9T0I3_YERAE|nr:Uncharacterised protein [Yersinia aleksiciae]CNK54238.1 Uncharacterised protein [Yersinia aleksiciae]